MLTDQERGFARGVGKLLKWVLIAVGVSIAAVLGFIALSMLSDWQQSNPMLWQGIVLAGLVGLAVHALYEIKRLLARISDQLGLIVRQGYREPD